MSTPPPRLLPPDFERETERVLDKDFRVREAACRLFRDADDNFLTECLDLAILGI